MQTFATREAASVAVAAHLARALDKALQDSPRATLVVTGGSSPAMCYQTLATTPLGWDRVDLVLSDERWVEPSHPDSNEKMVRETLVTDYAAAASLHPFFLESADIQSRCDMFSDAWRQLTLPTAACLLGMGEDGHIASLFPEVADRRAGTCNDESAICFPVKAAASPHLRISLTLPALLASREIILMFFGERKREVFECAQSANAQFPVSGVLQQNEIPVSAFWAP